MKSSGRKIELTSLDDLFSTEENRQEAKLEKIRDIPLTRSKTTHFMSGMMKP